MTDAASKPLILLDGPALGPLKGMLSAQYEVLTLWDQPDRAAFLMGPAKGVRVILGGGETLETSVVEALPNLGLIARIGSGYEAVNVPHARARGIAVTNTPRVNSEDVADHAVALLLAVVRGVAEGDAMIRSGEWTRAHRGPSRPSMKGLKVGVVGLGDVGPGSGPAAAGLWQRGALVGSATQTRCEPPSYGQPDGAGRVGRARWSSAPAPTPRTSS